MRTARRSLLALTLVLAAAAAGSARAEILINIDKSTQRMTVLRDGALLYTWTVSTGAPGRATPSGNFTAFRMDANHFSKEWDDAPMPHSIFFTKNGIAVHGTYETKHLGLPVSHGCVRLSLEHATTLFNLVKEDGLLTTKVVLSGSEQVALANRGARGTSRQVALRQPQRFNAQYDDTLDQARAALDNNDAPPPPQEQRFVDRDRATWSFPFGGMFQPRQAYRPFYARPYPDDDQD